MIINQQHNISIADDVHMHVEVFRAPNITHSSIIPSVMLYVARSDLAQDIETGFGARVRARQFGLLQRGPSHAVWLGGNYVQQISRHTVRP